MNAAEQLEVAKQALRKPLWTRGLYVLSLLFFVLMSARLGLRVIYASGRWHPIVRIQPLEYNFGDIKCDTTALATIDVLNAGQRPLELQNVHIGCPSCMQIVEDVKRVIPMQSHDSLTLEFHAPATPGKVIRTIAIHSNDPVHEVVIVKLIADVSE